MSQPYLGQIQPMSFNYAPKGWAECNGQLLSIAQNSALFSLIGTYYGGNGTTNFALPDLRSRVPLSVGQNGSDAYVIGETAGTETVMLTTANLPNHTHAFMGQTGAATAANPSAGALLAQETAGSQPAAAIYGRPNVPVPLNPGSLGPAGRSENHDNIQPYLTINWCIALAGIYPSRS